MVLLENFWIRQIFCKRFYCFYLSHIEKDGSFSYAILTLALLNFII